MSTDTQAPARPDLSALPWDVRLRIAVAETQGATWARVEKDDPQDCRLPQRSTGWWWLRPAPMDTRVWGLLYDDPVLGFRPESLPEYLTEPAAWGALLEKELHGYDTEPGRQVRCWWYRDEAMLHRAYGGWARGLPIAVSLAVLAKHAHPDLPALLESRP